MQDSAALFANWDEIQSRGLSLSESLLEAADCLEQRGLPPGSDVLAELQDFSGELQAFRNRIDPHRPAEQAAAEETISFAQIEAILERWQKLSSARSEIERILQLVHTDPGQQSVLAACHAAAENLLRTLEQPAAENQSEVRAWLAGEHTLQALLRLLEEGAALSDDEWSRLEEMLTVAYGRALTTALSRHKIISRDENSATTKDSGNGQVLARPESMTACVEQPAAASTETAVQSPVPIIVAEAEPALLAELTAAVSPDLHAPAVDTSASFLDADCPFNPLSPSSSLTLALATSRCADASLKGLDAVKALSEQAVTPSDPGEEKEAVLIPALDSRTAESRNSLAEESLSGSALGDDVASDLEESPARAPAVEEKIDHAAFVAALAENGVPLAEEAPRKISAAPPAPAVTVALPEIRRVELDARNPVEIEAERETTIFDLLPVPGDARIVSIAELAESALEAAEPQRTELLAAVQIELLFAGRYGLAYRLTQCLEQRPQKPQASLPLWLVRALALGEHVVFPQGKLAEQLRDDFGQFRREGLLNGDRGWNDALGFFLRAAAIRPAVLAPATRAVTLLRAVEINENLCHLYNYCSRIIKFSELDQGDVLQQLRPEEYEGARLRETETLLQDLKAWQQAVCRSPQAQQMLGPLLQALHQNEKSRSGWIRQEIKRLNGELKRIPEAAGHSRQGSAAALAAAELREQLQQGVGFASRWMELRDPAAVSLSNAFVPAALEEMRNSILERHEPALVEMVVFDQARQSRALAAGIAACHRAMQNVHDLFDPRLAPPFREPESRHVLSADLLKVSHLPLNSKWEPEVDPLALEVELLNVLTLPDLSWNEAWEMHMREQDHAATERLLELDVWEGEVQTDAMRLARSAQVLECRAKLRVEVQELRELLQQAHQGGQLDSRERAAFAGKLDRVDKSAERSLDFSAVEVQLAQIRSTLLRACQAALGSAGKTAASEHGSAYTSIHEERPRVTGRPGTSSTDTSPGDVPHRESVWVMDFN